MRGKKLLAAFLLGVGLCFVIVFGYGRVRQWLLCEEKVSWTDIGLLQFSINYIMRNPDSFLAVAFLYDVSEPHPGWFPKNVDTKNKVLIAVRDTRGAFSNESGIALLGEFKKHLEYLYSFIGSEFDINSDVVASFLNIDGIPLGYFYQGEYHLWEK